MKMDKKRAPTTAHQEKGDPFRQACMVLLVVVCIILISLTIMPNGRPEQGDAPTQSIVPHSGLPSESKAISPDSESASQSPEQQAYVLNLNTHKFHDPSCPSVGMMKESNKRLYTGTRESVIEMGYSPCERCCP